MTNVTIGRSLKSPPHWLLSRFALSFSFFFSFRMIYTDTVLMYLMCSSAPSASVICHHQLWSLSHQPSTYLVLFLLLLRTFHWSSVHSHSELAFQSEKFQLTYFQLTTSFLGSVLCSTLMSPSKLSSLALPLEPLGNVSISLLILLICLHIWLHFPQHTLTFQSYLS